MRTDSKKEKKNTGQIPLVKSSLTEMEHFILPLRRINFLIKKRIDSYAVYQECWLMPKGIFISPMY